MTNNSLAILVLALLTVLALIPLTSALGVSPAQTTLSTTQETFTIHLLNDENRTVDVAIRVSEELEEALALSTDSLTLAATSREELTVTVTNPQALTPGAHTGAIIVEEQPTTARGAEMVDALPAIRHRVTLTAPQDGKHLDARIRLSTTAANKPITVSVALKNTGDQAIQDVQAAIRINPPGEDLTTISKPLPVGATDSLRTTWTPETPGLYELEATVTYDEHTTTATRTVEVGELDLHVGQPVIHDFVFGEVARIDIPVTSAWNQELRSVNAQLRVYDSENRVVDEFMSLNTALEPLGQGTITAFWDTEGLAPGRYSFRATINFPPGQRTVEFSSDGVRTEEPGLLTSPWLAPVLSLLVALLALLGYVHITYINKRRGKEE